MSNYTIGQRNYQSLLSIDEELNFPSEMNYFFKLPHLGVLEFAGEKSTEMLQGQLTSDVAQLSHHNAQRSAMCNLQGRLLMTGHVLDWRGMKMILPSDLMANIQKSLNMPAMLAKVSIKPVTDLHVFGLYATDRQKLQLPCELPQKPFALCFSDSMGLFALDQQRFLGLATTEAMQTLQSSLAEKGSLAWHFLSVQNQEISIYPESSALFLPHRVDLPQHGYISFDKGCYKGQEIIARMHYRTKQKYKLKSFEITTTQTPVIGDKLLAAETNNEMGELVDWCPLAPDRYLILASVLLDCPERVVLHAVSTDK